MTIPIVIGVTGHRDPRARDLSRLKARAEEAFRGLMTRYPHSPFILLDSLAAGADMLCAEIALSLGMSLICPLPMPEDEYREDFSASEAATYHALRARAADVFVVPDPGPVPGLSARDARYRAAGEYVASHCHVLLALWDGSPAKRDGCGTAKTVDFMLNGNADDENAGFRALDDGAVMHIMTPRRGDEYDQEIASRLIENTKGALAETLRVTDAFNADAKKCPDAKNSYDLLPGEALKSCSGAARRLHGAFRQADGLSLDAQKKYLAAMRQFSVFGVLLVLFFLLYDELASSLFLLCYGALIVTYVFAYLTVRKKAYHAKYLQYRVLSETLRTQFYLAAGGLSANIAECYTWTQKQDFTWIRRALAALLIGGTESEKAPDKTIKSHWIDGQLKYHQKALGRDSRKRGVHESAARVMLVCSVALFAAVLTLEFFFPDVISLVIFGAPLPGIFLQSGGEALTLRCMLKILLGAVSAAAIFLSNYYGKLSFGRKSADHEKMALLYAAAKKRYEESPDARERVLWALAREEIIENGNWFSYCSENPPSFNV